MIVIGMIDIHDIKTEQDAITVTDELVTECCTLSRRTPMKVKRALADKMEEGRKVCFIKKWQAPLINMKKGFKMLESLKKSEDSMLSELFDIT